MKRLTVRRTASVKETAPEATAALYSPDEWPRMAEALEATGVEKSFCDREVSAVQGKRGPWLTHLESAKEGDGGNKNRRLSV